MLLGLDRLSRILLVGISWRMWILPGLWIDIIKTISASATACERLVQVPLDRHGLFLKLAVLLRHSKRPLTFY